MIGRIRDNRAGVLCVLALTLLVTPPATAQGVKPDVDMRAPYDVTKTTDGDGRTFVAFASQVFNRGPGVLKVAGRRQAARDKTMVAEQILLTTGSVSSGVPARTVPAGRLQFSPSADHNHWHFLRFEDYMLLSVPDLEFVAPTRKTGFCLLGLDTAFWCGSNHPEFLAIGGDSDYALTPNPRTKAMGMIAERGPDHSATRSDSDLYVPSVEGQDIEITGVPSGRYCLSFVANPQNRLVEERYVNNGASRLIDVGGRVGGERTLGLPEDTAETPTEFHESATCGLTEPTEAPPGTGSVAFPPLPALTRSDSDKLALTALKRKFHRLRGVRRSCEVRGANRAQCIVSFETTGARYRGSLVLSQRLRAGERQWFYKVDLRRTRAASCVAAPGACPARVKSATLLGGALGSRPVAARRVMRVPPGPAAPSRPGTAWPQSWLPPESGTRIRAYRPIG